MADADNAGNEDPARSLKVGGALCAAREQQGIAADEAAIKARVPKHYLEMIETDNYSMIADQLYLLPFVRRYAAFLGLDADETALRFVREVQHAEGTPIRAIEPMELTPRRRRRQSFWQRNRRLLIAGGGLIAAAALLYYVEHRRRQQIPRAAASPAAVITSIQAQAAASPPITNQ
ncbi:MAG TPA: helix-turn-helix transcriptional regulator, partial [Candidatus Binataceae bacterium]